MEMFQDITNMERRENPEDKPGFWKVDEVEVRDLMFRHKVIIGDGDEIISEKNIETEFALDNEGKMIAKIPAPISYGNKSIGETLEIPIEHTFRTEEDEFYQAKDALMEGDMKNISPKVVTELMARVNDTKLYPSGMLEFTGSNAVDVTSPETAPYVNILNSVLGYGKESLQQSEHIFSKLREQQVAALSTAAKMEATTSKKEMLSDAAATVVQYENQKSQEVKEVLDLAASKLNSRKTR